MTSGLPGFSPLPDLNPGPPKYQANALPNELSRLGLKILPYFFKPKSDDDGRSETETETGSVNDDDINGTKENSEANGIGGKLLV